VAIQTYKERSEHVKSRNKQAGIYSFKELGMDLEPYSLFPKEEVAKLLQLTFILITINVKAGKKVQIPRFGEFRATFLANGGHGRNPITGAPIQHHPRLVMKFKPYPFVRWLLAPYQKGLKIVDKEPLYKMYLDKVKAVFIQTPKYMNFFKEILNTYLTPERQFQYEELTANPKKQNTLTQFR
jgi:nucleoid DNA-binding protein